MEAGRELDALIAEKVFERKTELRACSRNPEGAGWMELESLEESDPYLTPIERAERIAESRRLAQEKHNTGIQYEMHPCYRDKHGFWELVPFYSTEIADAWQVVENLRKTWEYFFLSGGNGWRAEVSTHHVSMQGENIVASWDETVKGKPCITEMLAICLAALKAVGVNTE